MIALALPLLVSARGKGGSLVVERLPVPRGDIHAVFILVRQPGSMEDWLPGGSSSIEAALRPVLGDRLGLRQFFLLDHNGTVRQSFVGKNAETEYTRWETGH